MEVKVSSPTTKSFLTGKGTKKGGGKPSSCGHWVAFGNTEERYRVKVFGLKGRGRQRDGPFNHQTGRGWVQAQQGAYLP